MSRTRHTNQSPISLFPFLAVLISAMGALIFLLIVITSKVRSDVISSHNQQLPLPMISIEPTKTVALNEEVLLPAPAIKLKEPAPTLSHIPSPLIIEETPRISRTDAALEIEKLALEEKQWTAYMTQLDERLTSATTKIKEMEQEVLNKRAMLQTIQQNQEQKLDSSILLGEQTTKLEKELAKYRQQVDQLQMTRVDMQERQQKIKYQAATRSSEFAIIPFDGATGTTRRPIYLECTAEGITFHPEGITLKVSDLEQFTPRMNPLLSGVLVLKDYWQKEDQKKNPEDVRLPYILIVVRPSGTLSFYGAQTLLQRITTPMGYELIEEDRQLVYPPKSQVARELLIEAVKTTFQLKAGNFDGSGGTLAGTSGAGPEFSSDPRWSSKPGIAPKSAGGFPVDENKQLPGEMPGSARAGTGNTSTQLETKPEWVPDIVPGKPGANTKAEATPGNPSSNTEFKQQNEPNTLTIQQESIGQQNSAQSTEAKGLTGANTPTQSPGRMTFGEASQAPGSPSQKLEIHGKEPENSPVITNNKKKTWGATSSKMIGLEQSLLVKVNVDRIQVGERWVDVGKNETSQQLREAVYEMVVAEVNGWGSPPEGFRWIPSLKCQISPGGNTQFERFAQHLRREGFSVVAEQVFDK
jgi:hypothetical protein